MTYDQAVSDYRGLVHCLAKKVYRQTDLPLAFLDDLIQEGYIALMKAVDRFDESRGLKFITFAYPTVHGVMRRKAKQALRVRDREQMAVITSTQITAKAESYRWMSLTVMIRKEQRTILREIVVDLGGRDRAVMEGFMEGKQSCEVAEALGVSRSRVNFVRTRAMKKIEHVLRQREASSMNRQMASLEV